MTRLKSLIREEILSEFKVDSSVEEKIDEFGELSDQMDRVKKTLNHLKSRYGTLEEELREVLEQMEEHHQRSLQTKNYLITIKRKGYTRESYKYKKSFEESLTKVNSQTRKILQGVLQSTKSTKKVLSSVGVQSLQEDSILKKIGKKIYGWFSRWIPRLKKTNRELKKLNSLSRKMV